MPRPFSFGHVFAEEVCERSYEELSLRIVWSDPRIQEQHVLDLKKTYERLRHMFNERLSFPKKLEIALDYNYEISREYDFLARVPHFSPNNNRVSIPLRHHQYVVGRHLLSKHPKYSVPIHIHEIAHSIFDTNIKQRVTEFKKISAREESMRQLSLREVELEKALLHADSNKTQLKKELDEAYKESTRLQVEDQLDFASKLAVAYDELFADAVTVLFLDNPEAISQALSSPHAPVKYRADVQRRNFLNRYRSNELSSKKEGAEALGGVRNIEKNSEGKIVSYEVYPAQKEFESHTLFAPVRSHLHHHYFSKPNLKHRKAELIHALYVALESEIVDLLRAKNAFNYSPRELNERLIWRIDEVFRGL